MATACGPYGCVYHPGYAGAILATIRLRFALGSPWALVPASGGWLGVVVGTAFEGRVLIEELSGCQEYGHRIGYHLVPWALTT